MNRVKLVQQLKRPSAGLYLVGSVTAVNLLLAAVSFLKDLSFAAYFGTSRSADLVNTAFLLPESIGYNLVAAVISVAAVPTLSRLWSGKQTDAYVRTTLRMALHASVFMLLLAFMLLMLREPVLALSGYHDSHEVLPELKKLYTLLLASLPLFPLFAIGGAALQASGSFYAAAAGPLLLNGLMLVASAWSGWTSAIEETGAVWFAWSIVGGAALMTVMVWTVWWRKLRRMGISLHQGSLRGSKGNEAFGHELGRMYKDFFPFLLLTLCLQAVYAVERMLASNLGPGILAGLTYAYRVSQFPNWVFVAAVTSVLLPSLSRKSYAQSGFDGNEARRELLRALKGTIAVMLPAAVLLYTFRGMIIELLFGRGAFDAQSVSITSELLAGYSLSVVGQAISAVSLRYFIAEGRMLIPAIIYGATSLITLLFDWLAVPHLGPSAIGYGSMIGWWANAILMSVWVQRSFRYREAKLLVQVRKGRSG
ncbi:murein biosynthesis integral membrane protein MurJ [Paenibacillus sp. MMO-177]|uniref:murein biosynthesis integral membrane protein MurJ n=1 Tax=Paenibacillus sp. MMO-177 TaxID=3081289 RepID=UPI00301853E4